MITKGFLGVTAHLQQRNFFSTCHVSDNRSAAAATDKIDAHLLEKNTHAHSVMSTAGAWPGGVALTWSFYFVAAGTYPTL